MNAMLVQESNEFARPGCSMSEHWNEREKRPRESAGERESERGKGRDMRTQPIFPNICLSMCWIYLYMSFASIGIRHVRRQRIVHTHTHYTCTICTTKDRMAVQYERRTSNVFNIILSKILLTLLAQGQFIHTAAKEETERKEKTKNKQNLRWTCGMSC